MKLLSSLSLFLWLLVAGFIAAIPTSVRSGGLAFGLNGLSDWSTQHPFLDLMKSARPWIGHLPGQWGGMDFELMQAEGVFDENGWPLRVPEGLDRLEALILTDQPAEAKHLSGRYVVTFDGSGTLDITGRGRVVSRDPGQVIFTFAPGPGLVGVAIRQTDPENPIRNIRVIQEDHIQDYLSGDVFNPLWLDRIRGTQILRFMGWTNTNGSPVQSVADLPKASDFSFAWRGVPVSTMIDLANQIDADPWFNIPHLADDELVQTIAETVEDGLHPDRIAYVEYSNEMWNFIFEQAHWAQRQAQELWGDIGDGWMQFYGKRAAEVMQIWTDVFDTTSGQRLKRVVAVHTGWPELEQSSLFGDRAARDLGFDPAEMFDAYAVTGYFGYELGEPETLRTLLDRAETDAEARGRAEGLSRVALREYVKTNRFKGVAEPAADLVRAGSFNELLTTLWPYHAGVAETLGLELIMYEGGTHAAPIGAGIEDERLVSFLIEFSYSEPMGALYRDALSAWSGLTESPFNAFVDVAPPSQWGSWGALRHLMDNSPRWDALQQVRSGQGE